MEKDGYCDLREKQFWNNNEIVSYFAMKKYDLLVKQRLVLISDRPNKKVLDLGCGGGRHTELLCNLGFNVFACDVNKEMVRFTQERIVKLGFSKYVNQINFGNIIDLHYENSFFDVVISTGVLHQAKSLDDYRKAIMHLSRVLKPEGVVCLNIFTNKVIDPSYTDVQGEMGTYITKEGLYMTLLSKKYFYSLMLSYDLKLELELAEQIKEENTGIRAVLKANFIKI